MTAIEKMVAFLEAKIAPFKDRIDDEDFDYFDAEYVDGVLKMLHEARLLAQEEKAKTTPPKEATAGLVEELTHELDECDLCQVPVRKSTIREILSRHTGGKGVGV